MVEEFKRDFAFGYLVFKNSTDSEDKKEGIDGWIGDIPVATRKFRTSINEYQCISIRKRLFFRSEYDKIIAGEFKPAMYIYEYNDAYLLCKVSDILNCLEHDLYKEKPNKDGHSAGLYIQIGLLPHLVIKKEL